MKRSGPAHCCLCLPLRPALVFLYFIALATGVVEIVFTGFNIADDLNSLNHIQRPKAGQAVVNWINVFVTLACCAIFFAGIVVTCTRSRRIDRQIVGLWTAFALVAVCFVVTLAYGIPNTPEWGPVYLMMPFPIQVVHLSTLPGLIVLSKRWARLVGQDCLPPYELPTGRTIADGEGSMRSDDSKK